MTAQHHPEESERVEATETGGQGQGSKRVPERLISYSFHSVRQIAMNLRVYKSISGLGFLILEHITQGKS